MANVFKVSVRPIMIYGSETWPKKKASEKKWMWQEGCFTSLNWASSLTNACWWGGCGKQREAEYKMIKSVRCPLWCELRSKLRRDDVRVNSTDMWWRTRLCERKNKWQRHEWQDEVEAEESDQRTGKPKNKKAFSGLVQIYFKLSLIFLDVYESTS